MPTASDLVLNVEELICYLPRPKGYADLIEPQITAAYGTHYFGGQVNDREINIALSVDKITILPEASAAITTALNLGLIKPQDGTAAIFDIGMRTVIFYIVELGNGDRNHIRIISKSRDVLDGAGMNKLLSMIAQDPDFISRVDELRAVSNLAISEQGRANLQMLQRAIETETFQYGSSERGFNFKAIYDRHAPVWLRSSIQKALNSWQANHKWTDNLTRIIFIGGGASAAKGWVEDRSVNPDQLFVIATPEISGLSNTSQFATVIGGLLLSEEQKPASATYSIDTGSGYIKAACRGADGGIRTAALKSLFGDTYDQEVEPQDLGDESVLIRYRKGPLLAQPKAYLFGPAAEDLSSLTRSILEERKYEILPQAALAAIAYLSLQSPPPPAQTKNGKVSKGTKLTTAKAAGA